MVSADYLHWLQKVASGNTIGKHSALSAARRRGGHDRRSSRTTLPTYSLRVHEARRGHPVWDVSFRLNGRQLKRRIGPAWIRRGGPAPDVAFSEGAAHDRAREIVAELAAAAEAPAPSGPTFREVARDYLDWLERVRGAKPSTLADHRTQLAEPGERMAGRIMAALGIAPQAR